MNLKNYFAIATATVAFTVTAFAQWHPEIDKVKVRKATSQSIQSPRDVASGQATGKRKAPRAAQEKLGNFEIQDIKSPRDTASGQATGITSPRDAATGQATGKRQHKPLTNRPGFMDYTDDSTMNEVVAGQNSGGTITNQRRRKPTTQVQLGQNSGGTISNERRTPGTKGYTNGGITHEDTWEQKRKTARKRQ